MLTKMPQLNMYLNSVSWNANSCSRIPRAVLYGHHVFIIIAACSL